MADRGPVDQLIAELELAGGATVEHIAGRISALTGLAVEIDPLGDRDWETVTGLVVVSGESARILVRGSDPRWYQLHVVLHELAHLLFGHTGCATLPLAFDDLPRRADARVLARGVLREGAATVQESEAEALSHRLSEFVLAPRFAADEAIFG